MKTEVICKKFNYVYGKGYPIVIAQAFEDFDDHYIDFILIEANYNDKESKLVAAKTTKITNTGTLYGLGQILDFFIDIQIKQYENEIVSSDDSLINKSLPLSAIDSNLIYFVLGSLPDFDDIKDEIIGKIKSSEIKIFLNKIQTIIFE